MNGLNGNRQFPGRLRSGRQWEATLYASKRNSLFVVQVKLAKNDDIDLAEIRRGQTSIAEQLDVIQQELLAKIDKCESQTFSVSVVNSGSSIENNPPRVHDR